MGPARRLWPQQLWLPKNAVIVNKAAFDALDAPTKAALQKAGAEAKARGLAVGVQGQEHRVS